jgi:glycosyltransferase involved in cell wall biosynthesis
MDAVTYWHFPRQTGFYSFSCPMSQWLAEHVRDYDLVHIHALFSFPLISSSYWAAHHGVPYVIRPLGTLSNWGRRNRRPWLKRASIRWIDGPAVALAAAVHYTSEQEREEASVVITARYSVVIPNPVDLDFDRTATLHGWLPSRYPELAGKRTILFLSRLDPTKGLDILLPAMALLRARVPDVALVLAGSGDPAFVRSLHELAAQLKIEADVVWTGFLKGEQKRAAMSHATALVLPSYSENFGVAAAEALACGLPIIVSDRVGIHREVSAAGAGMVVPCQKDRLADGMAKVLGDGDLRARYIRNGLVLAKSFTIEAVAGQLADLYRRVGGHGTYA